jgi:hypothetical protein
VRWTEVSDEYDTLKLGTPGFVDPNNDDVMYTLAIAVVQAGAVDTMRSAREWAESATFSTDVSEDGTMWTYAEDADLTE